MSTRRLGQPFVLLAMLAVSACEGPTAPPPLPPDAPTLTCPNSITAVSPDGAPVPITYPVPTPVNGLPPVAVLCSSPSGSAFPPGSTIVTCTATDSLTRQGSCNFNVTVNVIPKISKTRFLAFGDSITAGRCGPSPNFCPQYSVRLEELLRARYTAQTFAVTNVGVPGETAACHVDDGKCGEDRLPGVLNAANPEVLLLMEGTNDLNGGDSQVPKALESLEDMINLALRRNPPMKVVIATIPPIAPGGSSNSTIPLVAPFNAEIRGLASRMGPDVALADVYAALNADVPRYYVGNDLHPTAEGHRLIGETFYAAIRAALDITPGGGSFSPASRPTDLFQPPGRPRFVKKQPGR